MSGIPRLNGVIKALDQGHTAFVSFCPVDIESAVAMRDRTHRRRDRGS